MIELDRRQLLAGIVGLAFAGPIAAARATAASAALPLRLEAGERRLPLVSGRAPTPIWSFAEEWPLVLRTPRAEIFRADLINALADQHTAIHWHGIRLPLEMDGVPYITQEPVRPGERFSYAFAPPDPGLFFFHPHCNTVEQVGRGLAGVLIVEDPREAGLFDVEHVLALKDWRLAEDGSYLPFITDASAAKAGSFGTLRTVNGRPVETLSAPPGAMVRLRIVNLDVTRVVVPALEGADGTIIATDGNASAPMPLGTWKQGPAMRLDVMFRMPQSEVVLADHWGLEPFPLARIRPEGKPIAARSVDHPGLPPAELPEPDLGAATRLDLELAAGHVDPAMEAWARETGFSVDALCATSRVFWSLNRAAWPGQGHEAVPPPLFELAAGRTYIIEIFNATPHLHPIHLHGHTFKVLGSSRREVVPHWADTVLVTPKERVEIAFVAGRTGDWMLHCHIIEHQETGMMGYVRVA